MCNNVKHVYIYVTIHKEKAFFSAAPFSGLVYARVFWKRLEGRQVLGGEEVGISMAGAKGRSAVDPS